MFYIFCFQQLSWRSFLFRCDKYFRFSVLNKICYRQQQPTLRSGRTIPCGGSLAAGPVVNFIGDTGALSAAPLMENMVVFLAKLWVENQVGSQLIQIVSLSGLNEPNVMLHHTWPVYSCAPYLTAWCLLQMTGYSIINKKWVGFLSFLTKIGCFYYSCKWFGYIDPMYIGKQWRNDSLHGTINVHEHEF